MAKYMTFRQRENAEMDARRKAALADKESTVNARIDSASNSPKAQEYKKSKKKLGPAWKSEAHLKRFESIEKSRKETEDLLKMPSNRPRTVSKGVVSSPPNKTSSGEPLYPIDSANVATAPYRTTMFSAGRHHEVLPTGYFAQQLVAGLGTMRGNFRNPASPETIPDTTRSSRTPVRELMLTERQDMEAVASSERKQTTTSRQRRLMRRNTTPLKPSN